MDVITMPSTTSLLKRVKNDYPQFVFKKSTGFSWSQAENTVNYTSGGENSVFLLHELSHGLLGHADYSRDIELIAMEREAWDKAEELATKYGIPLDDNFIQSTLDTYRDWLHSRSTCPKCTATGLQTDVKAYKCLACGQSWRVNEARTCALRRYGLNS